MAKTVYCCLCNRPVQARRKIGIGTLILVLITGGLWLFAIPFYRKRCPICEGTDFICPKEAEELKKFKQGKNNR